MRTPIKYGMYIIFLCSSLNAVNFDNKTNRAFNVSFHFHDATTYKTKLEAHTSTETPKKTIQRLVIKEAGKHARTLTTCSTEKTQTAIRLSFLKHTVHLILTDNHGAKSPHLICKD